MPIADILRRLDNMERRVEDLHARNVSEIETIKTDTQRIRESEHEVRGTLQQFIAAISAEQTMLKMHMAACERRGERLEKFAIGAIGIGIAIFGFLLKLQLFPGR